MNKRERIEELALKGYSQAEIAKKLDCSRSYVNLIKKKDKLTFVNGNSQRLDIDRNKSILWDYLSGESFARLGAKHGIHATMAYKAASDLIPCTPWHAKKILAKNDTHQISNSKIKSFFETLEALYGKRYRELMAESTQKVLDTRSIKDYISGKETPIGE